MNCVILGQLPVPKSNFGVNTGNIPLGPACLAQAAAGIPGVRVDILPQELAALAGDALLIDYLVSRDPDFFGLTVYCWNMDRSLYVAETVKEKTGCRILLGGPEITADHPKLVNRNVDFLVAGEGEQAFQHLMAGIAGNGPAEPADGNSLFQSNPSPYLTGHLRRLPMDPMFLETQRGCPFSCGFCRYSKDRQKTVFRPGRCILEAVEWAANNHVREVFFLDPTLNARPDLPELLRKLARLNPHHGLEFSSEIRAERMDDHLAGLFRKAGFTEFEIGLQSTHTDALRQMGRRLDVDAFLKGTAALKRRGIRLKVDLILGLPGDTPDGFRRSLDFVMDNDLADHIQVFPLLVLPGTRYRRQSRELGLVYDPAPPYTVCRTRGFSPDDIDACFDLAEDRLDTALIPMPDLDLAWRKTGEDATDHWLDKDGTRMVTRVVLDNQRPEKELTSLARHLVSPYQIFVRGAAALADIGRVVRTVTRTNPCTPLEIVFLAPPTLPDIHAIVSASGLHRPHFLDRDLDLLYPEPGNRAILFTLVTPDVHRILDGPMVRQVHWWKRDRLPGQAELEGVGHLDGVLVDSPVGESALFAWQDRFRVRADDLPLVSFPEPRAQARWQGLISSGEYIQ